MQILPASPALFGTSLAVSNNNYKYNIYFASSACGGIKRTTEWNDTYSQVDALHSE